MTQQQPIIIKGKLAKQIYNQILKSNLGIDISNDGTAKNPILRMEVW